jgi:hypothetical protein
MGTALGHARSKQGKFIARALREGERWKRSRNYRGSQSTDKIDSFWLDYIRLPQGSLAIL